MHAVPRGDGTYDWTPEPFKPFKVNPPPASLFRDEGFVSYQDSALKKGELYHIKEHRRGQAAARRAKGYVGGFQYGKGLQGNPEALAAAYSQKARDLSGVLGDGFPGVLNPAYKPGQDNQVAAYQEYLTRERKENEDMKIRGRYD